MKAIVSVIGKDKKGIIAGVSGLLSDMDVNIEDISQTILQEYFTMIMAVELGQKQALVHSNQRATDAVGRKDRRGNQDAIAADIRCDAQDCHDRQQLIY